MSESCQSGGLPSVSSSVVTLFHVDPVSAGAVLHGGHGECAAAGRRDDAQRQSPRSVITGGNSFPSEQNKPTAFIDWFAFTLTPPPGFGLGWLAPFLMTLFSIPGMVSTGKGWFGYKERFDLGGSGLLAYGGESQRGSIHVELNSLGCSRVPDWGVVRDWCESLGVAITRIDLAHDDFEGASLNIEKAMQWYREGAFTSNGRPPVAQLIDDLGSGKGKTLYIGKRGSGKFSRCYEKGKQLGDPASPWVRFETELHNKGRVIPFDVLVRPGEYLAGAYPVLSFLSTVQERIKTISKAATISLGAVVYWMKQGYGKAANVLMQAHGGDADAVMKLIIRPGIPRRLENYVDFLPEVLARASS